MDFHKFRSPLHPRKMNHQFNSGGFSSGVQIRTEDLQVMREKPDFGNFDRITMQISQLMYSGPFDQSNLRWVISVRIVSLLGGVKYYILIFGYFLHRLCPQNLFHRRSMLS